MCRFLLTWHTFQYVGVRFSVCSFYADLFWPKRPAHRDNVWMWLSPCAGLFCIYVSFVYTYIHTFLYVGARFSVLCLCAGLFWQKRPAHRDQPKVCFCFYVHVSFYVYMYIHTILYVCARYAVHIAHIIIYNYYHFRAHITAYNTFTFLLALLQTMTHIFLPTWPYSILSLCAGLFWHDIPFYT